MAWISDAGMGQIPDGAKVLLLLLNLLKIGSGVDIFSSPF